MKASAMGKKGLFDDLVPGSGPNTAEGAGTAVPVPSGRLSRMARLGGLALSAGAGMVLKKSEEEAAAQAAKVLGDLRGLAAKLGQMASYVDGLVPEDKRDAFEGSLKVLRSQAPRSSASVVRASIGAPSS
ncbi:MAG TPA: hypothetical protein VM580_04130, partial [Labilithrix sp.]|nr:hypothetical protein [Labilithrix sp.]